MFLRISIWFICIVIAVIIILILSKLFQKSYYSDFTKTNYSVVVFNETSKPIEKVDMTINDVFFEEEKEIQKGEYRKFNINIEDERLARLEGSYNVSLNFTDTNMENITAGYFTSEWGGFKVIVINNDNEGNILAKRINENNRLFKKLLKRHYYNPYELSWFK